MKSAMKNWDQWKKGFIYLHKKKNQKIKKWYKLIQLDTRMPKVNQIQRTMKVNINLITCKAPNRGSCFSCPPRHVF